MSEQLRRSHGGKKAPLAAREARDLNSFLRAEVRKREMDFYILEGAPASSRKRTESSRSLAGSKGERKLLPFHAEKGSVAGRKEGRAHNDARSRKGKNIQAINWTPRRGRGRGKKRKLSVTIIEKGKADGGREIL